MDLELLLAHDEDESLDFKRQFHSNNVELVHDLLCLANAYVEGDRFLVFGIADDRTVFGIEGDPCRKTNAQIQDLLRGSNLNRIPDVRVSEIEVGGRQVSVVTIRNRPDKPFFTLKDKVEGKKVLRAGVVYTRICDTNVPLRESAPEDRIEMMWRERFGIGLSPMERLMRLLREPDAWIEQTHSQGVVFYHREFPDFTIAEGEQLVDDFREPWAQRFHDRTASSVRIELRYHATILRTVTLVNCDGYRYHLPLPDRDGSRFFVDRESTVYLVARLFRQYRPLDEALSYAGVEVLG